MGIMMEKQKKAGRQRIVAALFLILLAEVWGIVMLGRKEMPEEMEAKDSGTADDSTMESLTGGSASSAASGAWERFMIYHDGGTCIIYRYDEKGNAVQKVYGAEETDKDQEESGKDVSCTIKWILKK